VREISPAEISGKLSALFVVLVRMGAFSTFAVCLLLPKLSIANHKDQWWRVELGFPMILVIIQFLFLLFLYNHETPKGSLLKNNKNNVYIDDIKNSV